MHLFKFPVVVCHKLDALISEFWWGKSGGQHSIHWVANKSLGLAKSQGGIGFRNFQDFNNALLVKQCWRLIHDPTSLWARVLKA